MNIIRSANLRKWVKVGKRIVLARVNGLTLYNQTFFNPNTGERSDYSFVSKKEGITVCAVAENGNLILVREYKQGAEKFIIGFPAGLLEDSDNSRQEAALRELLEETGYRPKKLIVYNPFYIAPRKSPSREWPAVALGCELIREPRLDKDEGRVEVVEMSKKDFFELVREGRILMSEATLATAFVAIANGHI